MAKISEMFDKPISSKRLEPDTFWIMPKDAVGLEFEYEGVSAYPPGASFQSVYTVKEDGSLRDHGREFVFREPLFGKDLTDALATMDKTVKYHGYKVNYRTGLHVHLDVRDMEIEQLWTLLLVYAVVEPLLFAKFVGEDRYNNNFCVPWARTGESFKQIAKLNRQQTAKQLQAEFASIDRYAALNLQAVYKYGSIEFRHLENTLDFKRIESWINVIYALKRFAMTRVITQEAILELVSYRGPRAFVDDLFAGCEFLRDIATYVDLDSKVFEGVYLAQDLILESHVKAKYGGGLETRFKGIKGTNQAMEKFLKSQVKVATVASNDDPELAA